MANKEAEDTTSQGIRISVDLSDELFDRARQVARSKKTTINAITSTALSGYLDQLEEISEPSGEDIFSMPRRTIEPKVRIIAEFDAEIGQAFKQLCRKKGWYQKDVLERFIRNLVEHHKEREGSP